MKNWIKNLFKKNETNEIKTKEEPKNKEYLVKKIVYEEVVDEDGLKRLIDEYNMQIKPTGYARKNGVNMISFQPRPSYWLDIEEIWEE